MFPSFFPSSPLGGMGDLLRALGDLLPGPRDDTAGEALAPAPAVGEGEGARAGDERRTPRSVTLRLCNREVKIKASFTPARHDTKSLSLYFNVSCTLLPTLFNMGSMSTLSSVLVWSKGLHK